MIEDNTVQTLGEAPEWLVMLMWATIAFAAIWLVASVFVHLRRKASNLTPVTAAKAKKSATPDFMKVDHKAREEAIKRGEAFDKELAEREAAEAAAKAPAERVSGLAKLASLLFSLFTLGGAIVGVISTADRMGETVSKMDQLGALLMHYPIQFAVCVFVIGFYIYSYFANKSWESAKPRI